MTDELKVLYSESEILSSTPQAILLIAIEELDLLVSELIRTGRFSISRHFHDWVADSLTTTVEKNLLAAHQSNRLENSLRLGNPRHVISHWVRHWVCLELKKHFGQYSEFCPCAKSSALPHSDLSVASSTSAENKLSADSHSL